MSGISDTRNAPLEADQDPVHATAADWFARLKEPSLSLEDVLAWQDWMRASELHVAAFRRIEELAAVLHAVPRPDLPAMQALREDRYDASVPVRNWRPVPPRSRNYSIAAGLIIVAVGLTAFLVKYPSLVARSRNTVISTVVGENRAVQLSDGSRVTLGGDSVIEVSLRPRERIVRLQRGEALFSVSKDRARPFKVEAGDAQVVAVGTQFDVRRRAGHVLVEVVEGRVLVEPISHVLPMALMHALRPKLVPVRVNAGEQTVVAQSEIEPTMPIPDIAAATSWQNGRLSFRMTPLRAVLEDVNRYAAKPIVVEGDEIGDIKVTGTVVSADVAAWVASLDSALGLVSFEEPDEIVLRRRQVER